MFMSMDASRRIILEGISERKILLLTFMRVNEDEAVDHRIAPFDIGTTTPETMEKNRHNMYGYAYDHKSKKGLAAPRVLPFDLRRFVALEMTDEVFDPMTLIERHRVATTYDYRTCTFAVLPDRGWF
jgi:hypothetical protein